MNALRQCSRCKTPKALPDFKRDKRKPGGVSSVCKACSQGAAKDWRSRNKEHTATYRAGREKFRGPRVRRKTQRVVLVTPEMQARRRLYNKKWEKANPLKLRIKWHNRRAREQAAEGVHTHRDVARILLEQKWKCAYCRVGIRKHYHIDHIRALSRGGSNWPKNIQLLCGACNLRKHAADPMTFSRKLGLLL